jgi:hypothetical protein
MNGLFKILTFILSFNLFAANDDEFKKMYLCFDITEMELNIDYDRVRWPDSQLTDVCSININVPAKNSEPAYFYYSRSWIDPDFCKKFSLNWNELNKEKDRKVCIAARLDSADKIKRNGKEILERSASYEVIKSGNWCHSYFSGYCD